jgi:hypothetical protein
MLEGGNKGSLPNLSISNAHLITAQKKCRVGLIVFSQELIGGGFDFPFSGSYNFGGQAPLYLFSLAFSRLHP